MSLKQQRDYIFMKGLDLHIDHIANKTVKTWLKNLFFRLLQIS
jgi:hypothetical protein